MNKRKAGILFVALGLFMVIEALLLGASYQKQEDAAGRSSAVLLQEYKAQAQNTTQEGQTPPAQEDTPLLEEPYREMETLDHNGLQIIGVLRVPSCGVELPILKDWSYPLLDMAPCRYSGNLYAGDLVLLGHNYSTHFKPLKSVQIGETVEFETVDGTIWRYVVEEVDSIHKNDVQSLPSEHELILFTCENYRVYRCVIRCRRVA